MADEAGLDVAEQGTDGAEPRARIEAVHFEEWAPLGGPVTLTLSPRRTVLVGWNGSGKSLLLEGLQKVIWIPASPGIQIDAPRSAKIDLRMTTNETMRIQYTLAPKHTRQKAILPQYDYSEKFWNLNSKEPSFENSKNSMRILDIREKVSDQTPEELLKEYKKMEADHPKEFQMAATYYVVYAGIVCINAEMPQSQMKRRDILWNYTNPESQVPSSLEELSQELANLRAADKELFEEIEAVGKRIGVWQTLSVEVYSPTHGHGSSPLGAVLVNGVNIGRVSDGTLRILSILRALIDRTEHPLILLIDEPELGIHPGLLARLLNEIDAYSDNTQVVIATHSPQVVSWAKPEELRLVERKDGRTTVRSLDAEQVERVYSYLQDEGSLGEFLYSGGLDD